jgi:hypothetical protein
MADLLQLIMKDNTEKQMQNALEQVVARGGRPVVICPKGKAGGGVKDQKAPRDRRCQRLAHGCRVCPQYICGRPPNGRGPGRCGLPSGE